MPAPNISGIYPADSVLVGLMRDSADLQEVHQSLPLDPLGPGAADLLAGDVEYRLHYLLQEAKKFMVHGKRNTLMPDDIEHAMEALNVEVSMVNIKSDTSR